MADIELSKFKQEARERKNATGKKLCHCYEQMAQEQGYNTYAALLAHMKANQATVE